MNNHFLHLQSHIHYTWRYFKYNSRYNIIFKYYCVYMSQNRSTLDKSHQNAIIMPTVLTAPTSGYQTHQQMSLLGQIITFLHFRLEVTMSILCSFSVSAAFDLWLSFLLLSFCPFLFLLLLKKLDHFFTWYNFPQNSVYITYKIKLSFLYHQPGISLSISRVLIYHNHISQYAKCLLQKYLCSFFLNTSLF